MSDDIVRRMSVSAAVVSGLPSMPDYNGSILMIDHEELVRVEDDLRAGAEAIETLRARIAALEAEKSDMLKAMQDARRALAYAQKYDTVMEISYLKLDAAICAVKPAKEG